MLSTFLVNNLRMKTTYDQRYRIFITNDSDKGKQQEQPLHQL
jgi:hypothetical protein